MCRLLVCFAFVPQLSHAQNCEWDRFPEPSAGTDVIEVLEHGGFRGRTLVSVDATGRILLLARGQCPDRARQGFLETPTFDELVADFRRALESVRSQPPRPRVSDEHPADEIVREGRLEPFCESPEDGMDLDVTLYSDGSKEHYRCVTGALLRFGEDVIERVFHAVCTNQPTAACVEWIIGVR